MPVDHDVFHRFNKLMDKYDSNSKENWNGCTRDDLLEFLEKEINLAKSQARVQGREEGIIEGYKSKQDGETQLQRVVRRAEEGEFNKNFTPSISRYGIKLTRLDVTAEELHDVLFELEELAMKLTPQAERAEQRENSLKPSNSTELEKEDNATH